jgi:hypothetical protein
MAQTKFIESGSISFGQTSIPEATLYRVQVGRRIYGPVAPSDFKRIPGFTLQTPVAPAGTSFWQPAYRAIDLQDYFYRAEKTSWAAPVFPRQPVSTMHPAEIWSSGVSRQLVWRRRWVPVKKTAKFLFIFAMFLLVASLPSIIEMPVRLTWLESQSLTEVADRVLTDIEP